MSIDEEDNEMSFQEQNYAGKLIGEQKHYKPKLLDLCCCAGGASVGYFLAGFDVTGVDQDRQRDYPFRFIQANVLDLTYEDLLTYDAIHASIPCQGYCTANVKARNNPELYPDIYHKVKAMLVASGKPYVMENVLGSPLKGFRLCGTMFGLGVFRHRIFETNFHVSNVPPCSCSSKRIDGEQYATIAGSRRRGKKKDWQRMGTPWITDPDKVKEAIPPAYTEWIGLQMSGSRNCNGVPGHSFVSQPALL